MSQNFSSQHSYESSNGSYQGERDFDRGRRKRSTSRSRSRSDSRDRKRRGSVNYDREGNASNQRTYGQHNQPGGYRENRNERGGNDHRGYGGNDHRGYGGNRNAPSEPSLTVVVKGLPVHTTENTDGECKGFAFITFPSLDYSHYFMNSYAGSAGDPNAPQLIIENRSVTIEYAREQADRRGKDDFMKRDDKHRGMKGDWLCEACACHNFSRRDTCYRCSLPRSERSITVASTGEAFGDSLVQSEVPSAFLVVRGFGSYVTEEQIAELFRQFAVVKSTVLIRDQQGRVTKSSMAFVEFHSVEHAAYALQCSAELKMDANSLKISFAKEAIMHQIISQYQIMLAAQSAIPGAPVHKQPSYPPGIIGLPSNALVATALQAAQWSMNNGYGGSTAVPTTLATTVPVKPKQMWPKHFETNGAAYAFQPKTGYFLDSVTEFFYCPKSKLYYSAKDGIYYQFDPSIDPPFKRFDPPLPTEEETQPEEKESADGSSSAARAPISLSLGLKSKGSKSGGLANSAAKKVMVDIAKWGAIQREDDEDEVDTNAANKGKAASITNPGQAPNVDEKKTMVASTSATTTGSVEQADQPSLLAEKSVTESSNLSSPQTSVDAQNTSSASSNTVKATSGSCICKLCKRQFNSAEMLARHEKESKLHAENLAKQKAAAGAAPPRQYRDRAEERREKFGSVPDHIPSVTSATVASSAVNDNILPFPPNAETVSAPVLFDESNPGNQMLRKMGWKEGQGLGKDGEGKEEAVGVELATGKNTNTAMHSTLKSTVGTSGVNSSMSYKECVKAATLARFEQLQRSEEK